MEITITIRKQKTFLLVKKKQNIWSLLGWTNYEWVHPYHFHTLVSKLVIIKRLPLMRFLAIEIKGYVAIALDTFSPYLKIPTHN